MKTCKIIISLLICIPYITSQATSDIKEHACNTSILKVDTCYKQTIIWEQGSYNHTKAYMKGYEVILKRPQQISRGRKKTPTN